jgi:hypothetical protein
MKKVANPAKTTKAEPAKKRQPIKKTQATKKSHPTKKVKKPKKVWLPAVAPEKPKPKGNWQQKPHTWTFSADPELAEIEPEMVAFAEECLGADGAQRLILDAAIFYQRFVRHPALARYDPDPLYGACLNAARTDRNRDTGGYYAQPLEVHVR